VLATLAAVIASLPYRRRKLLAGIPPFLGVGRLPWLKREYGLCHEINLDTSPCGMPTLGVGHGRVRWLSAFQGMQGSSVMFELD